MKRKAESSLKPTLSKRIKDNAKAVEDDLRFFRRVRILRPVSSPYSASMSSMDHSISNGPAARNTAGPPAGPRALASTVPERSRSRRFNELKETAMQTLLQEGNNHANPVESASYDIASGWCECEELDARSTSYQFENGRRYHAYRNGEYWYIPIAL